MTTTHAAELVLQPSLYDPLPRLVHLEPVAGESADAAFERWIGANPHVLSMFIDLALQLQRAGRRRIGAKAIVERMRWEYMLRTDGDGFKLNNNWTSRLARAAVRRRPELADVFEFRELRT